MNTTTIETTIKIKNTPITVSYISIPTRVANHDWDGFSYPYHERHNNPTVMGLKGVPMTESNVELAREALIVKLNAWSHGW